MKTKLYCYVDETGQDTRGKIFIVGIVIVPDEERGPLEQACLVIEHRSGKGNRKWAKSSNERRFKFTEQVIADSTFAKKLYVSFYRDELNYVDATVRAISRAADTLAFESFELTIYVDGLPREMERTVGLHLREAGVPAKKVRGARDENEVLIRLADTVCGFVRQAKEGAPAWTGLLAQAKQKGVLTELR